MSGTRVAVIGLGRMGWHMAAHLSRAGNEMSVCDVVPGVAKQWADEHGGEAHTNAADAVAGCEVVITSLPADRELRAVADVVLPELGRGSLWVDHSTTSAGIARIVHAEAKAVGVDFLDAPVSGGVDGARNGTLTVMVGGDASAFERAEPVIASYGARITLMGDSGAGQITKMTNQICVVGLCQALAEGLDFAESAGLDVSKVIHVMLQGSSASWQMTNRAEKMLAGEYNYGFSTTLMRKDIGLVLEEARAMNVPLPVTAMVGEMLAEVSAMGGDAWDWCSLMERQRHSHQ
ncbi:MAG: NAD(P)-dependent oxidoreductase [Ilumatobacteraceae bacterium]